MRQTKLQCYKCENTQTNVINEDELIWFVREFIISTETTVEEDRPAYERLLVRETPDVNQKWENMSLVFLFIIAVLSVFYIDYILIKLYINSLFISYVN